MRLRWDPPSGCPNSSRGGTQVSPKDWCFVWVLATACPAQTTIHYCLSFLGPSFLPIADNNPLFVCGSQDLPSFLASFIPANDRQRPGRRNYLYATWWSTKFRIKVSGCTSLDFTCLSEFWTLTFFLLSRRFYFPEIFIYLSFFWQNKLWTLWKFLFFYCKLDYFCLIFWRKFANFLKLKNWEKKAYYWSAIWFFCCQFCACRQRFMHLLQKIYKILNRQRQFVWKFNCAL